MIEAFGELNLPVLRDSPIGELLELNGAVRWTQNKAANAYTGEKKSSEAVSYKLSGIYEIGAGVRLRGSRSRDIRAPGFRELFERNVPSEEGTTLGIVDNPATDATVGNDDATPILNGGSFALDPEKADTTTAGVVFRPDFIRGLRVVGRLVPDRAAGRGEHPRRADDRRLLRREYELFCDRITTIADHRPSRPAVRATAASCSSTRAASISAR